MLHKNGIVFKDNSIVNKSKVRQKSIRFRGYGVSKKQIIFNKLKAATRIISRIKFSFQIRDNLVGKLYSGDAFYCYAKSKTRTRPHLPEPARWMIFYLPKIKGLQILHVHHQVF